MRNLKLLLTAACLSVASLSVAGAGTAQAAPWDHHGHGPAMRHETHRPYVAHDRVFNTLRFHHYRGLGEPYFLRGHYVVKSYDRRGRVVFVEVDPYSGAFVGEFRR